MVSYDLAQDGSLIAQLQHGDTSALAHLYDRYSTTAMRVAHRLLGDHATSEDVVQDSFLSLWKNADSYNPRAGSVNTWLFSIVRHRALDRLRRYRPDSLAPDVEVEDVRSVSVHGVVAERLDRERIRFALHSLPEPQRDVITRVYFKGCTAKEVADQLDIPVGTVKSRLRLALQHLRAEVHRDDFVAEA